MLSQEQKLKKLETILRLLDMEAASPDVLKEILRTVTETIKNLKTAYDSAVLILKNKIENELSYSSLEIKKHKQTFELELDKIKNETEKKFSAFDKKFAGEIKNIKETISALPEPKEVDEENIIMRAGFAVESLKKEMKQNFKEIRDEIETLRQESKTTKSKTVSGTMSLPVAHWPLHELFTMNGADTSVTLSAGVSAQGTALIVRYQGQTLDMTTHYTVSGNKISLLFTPENATVISVTYWP